MNWFNNLIFVWMRCSVYRIKNYFDSNFFEENSLPRDIYEVTDIPSELLHFTCLCQHISARPRDKTVQMWNLRFLCCCNSSLSLRVRILVYMHFFLLSKSSILFFLIQNQFFPSSASAIGAPRPVSKFESPTSINPFNKFHSSV